VHFLAGGVYATDGAEKDTDPAFAIGGGWEYVPRRSASTEGWAIRVHADYLVRPGEDFPRVSVGGVYRLK
jgi:hypothetical protein